MQGAVNWGRGLPRVQVLKRRVARAVEVERSFIVSSCGGRDASAGRYGYRQLRD